MNIGKTNRAIIPNIITLEVPESKKTEQTAQTKTPETIDSGALQPGDTVEISPEAKNKAEDFQKKLDEMRNEMKALREGLKQAAEAGKGAAEGWKEKIKCLQIAMRIISGNKVPEEDHRYLRERDVELYSRAIQLRIEKEDPKEYDKLSEEEKRNNENPNNPETTTPTIPPTQPPETATPPPETSTAQ